MQRNDQYARAADVILDALKAYLPAESVSVSEYAARNRWIANHGGGYVGMWSHSEAPYLTAPMDSLTDPAFSTVAIVGPAQCGKTEIAQNWLMHSVGADPANMLWYSVTDFLIRSFVKNKINPMIELNDVLSARLGKSSTDNSLSFKRFGSMSVEFLGASNNTLISRSSPRLVLDEYDAIIAALGDIMPAVDMRRATFGDYSKLVCISHPDLAEGLEPKNWKRGVMHVYRGSNRNIWYWQCPDCGCWSSPNPTAPRQMVVHYHPDAPIDEIADMARLLCPVNGCLIEDKRRRSMNLTGQWIGQGQELEEDGTLHGELVTRTAAGWWIVGPMSTLMQGGIGKLAADRAQAERDYAASQDEDDKKTLGVVLSKQWGEPPTKKRNAEQLDAGVIAARADKALKLGMVANGVRFITAFVDVQPNRFEVMVRGWGVGGESWVIDYRVIVADTAIAPSAWDELLALICETAWPLDDGSGRGMKARLCGYDSSGAPGTTQQAYDAWKRFRKARKVRLLGKIDGRDCWSVLPMKGGSTANCPRLQVVYPDTERKDRYVAARGEIPVGIFNPNLFKDDLAGQLAKADAGPWAVHFPHALRAPHENAETHPFFDGLVAERRKKNGGWEKVSPRNEPLDLMVGNHVLAFLMGMKKIDWARPPAWAAEWPANSNVVARALVVGEPPALPVPHMAAQEAGVTVPAPPAIPAAAVVGARSGRFVTSVQVRR